MGRLKKVVWQNVRRSLSAIGIDASVKRPDHHYVARYYGRTAYKHVDIRTLEPFGDLARAAINTQRTLLYYDRLYPIFQSLENMRRFRKPGTALNTAEVGVFRGGTSRFIAEAAARLGFEEHLHHGFDTFEGHSGADISAHETNHRAGHFSETSFESVAELLKPFPNVKLFKGRVQDTAGAVDNLTFHFVHLDVDIYEPMLWALRFFGERLAIGANIIVDDYYFRTCPGVNQAVEEFLSERLDFFPLHLLSGQCVLIRTGEESR